MAETHQATQKDPKREGWTWYSKDEDAILREHYPDKTLEELAALLPARTPASITHHAARLKLRKSPAYLERIARATTPVTSLHCLVCHGRIHPERQDDLCVENPRSRPFVITTQSGGRGSGFLPVEDKCFTLEEALANPETRPIAVKYLARLQKVARLTGPMTEGPSPGVNPTPERNRGLHQTR